MALSRPTVITDIGLAEFIQYVLDHSSRSARVIICAAKEAFIQALLEACAQSDHNVDQQPPHDGEPSTSEDVRGEIHDLLKRPSLLELASSRRVKLTFCPTLTHLRAHLSTLAIPKPKHTIPEPSDSPHGHSIPLLAILNPVDLHRATSSFSAQGLNRTFALAVEAAHATKSQLNLVEFPSFGSQAAEDFEIDYDLESEISGPPPSAKVWDEDVSILNVTTRSFGAGGRGWVGRTVTVRRIAERWCIFAAFQRRE